MAPTVPRGPTPNCSRRFSSCTTTAGRWSFNARAERTRLRARAAARPVRGRTTADREELDRARVPARERLGASQALVAGRA
jgi:hypothetical protein